MRPRNSATTELYWETDQTVYIEDPDRRQLESKALAVWEQHVDEAYRELVEEFQTACDHHIEAMRTSLKELILFERRPFGNTELNRISRLQATADNNSNDEDDEDLSLFHIRYGECNVLERMWRHREWSASVWICLAGVIFLGVVNIFMAATANHRLTSLTTGTQAILCAITNDSEFCQEINLTGPSLHDVIKIAEENIKQKFNIELNKLIEETKNDKKLKNSILNNNSIT